MGSPSLFRRHDGVAHDHDLLADLAGGGDDFALTMSSRLDTRFWVRVEREMVDGALVVTDFAPGTRPTAELAAGLRIVVRALSPGGVRALAFRDIVPGGDQVQGFPAKIVHAADLVKQLGAAVAEGFSDAGGASAVASFEMRPRNGRIDARVTFAPTALV